MFVVALSLFLLAGCSEEKAKALRLAAETFRGEADAACALGAESIKAAVSLPPRTRAEISSSLAQARQFGARELEIIYADSALVDEATRPALRALDQACSAQRQLAALYTDLPRAYLLATADVKRAQKHVVNVTMRFARLAQVFYSLPNVGRDNVARIRIIEARARAMAVADETARAALLDAVAEEILDNQKREVQRRDRLLTQFSRATAVGEQLTQMSMDYEQLSVADLLDTLQSFSLLYGELSGRTVAAQSAIEEIRGVEARISSDPRLAPLLDVDLVK